MTPIEFLHLVLPDAGFKVLATPAKPKGFRHRVHPTREEVAAEAAEYSGRADLFFGLGGLRERSVETTLPDGTKKKRVRVATNVVALRAFWLDIDCGEGKPYATKRDAVAALVAFCRNTMLPAPLIVDSGGGLHCYWPLDADVTPGEWKPVALRLKALTVALALHCDPTRTADVSSVLRVPGTFNLKKDQRRPVVILRDAAKVMSLDSMRAVLESACETAGVEVRMPSEPASPEVAAANAALGEGLVETAPSDPKKIIAGCQQLRRIATKQEEATEPEWYAALQIARFCEGHMKVAHAISRKHPMYTVAATNEKMAQLAEKGIGPTLCARFESLHAGGCKGCPHEGKLTTPLQLGRVVQSQPVPVVQAAGIQFELPDAPEPYSRTKRGIVIRMEDADGTPMAPVIVYPYDLYPVQRTFDEFTGRMKTTFRTYGPMQGWHEFDIDNQDLYDSRALPKALANADLLPNPAKIKMLGDYMVSYTQKLQAVAESTRLFMQMGWRDENTKFIIGDTMLSAGGTPLKIGVSAATELASEKLTTVGDLDVWKNIAAAYTRPGMEPYLFGFATAFGAPLFGFTNYSGAIVNMLSKPGTGKSTVLKAMNSVYGHPDSLMFSKEDTTRSVYRRIGVLNNLPIAFDEITNIEPAALSDLAYNFSQGRERMRLTAAATERRDAYKWTTIMAATANASLHDKLGALKSDASAETVRIFEYRMPDVPPMDALEAKNLFDDLYTNYGHAGRVYMQFLLDNLPWAREQLKKMIDLVFTRTKAPSSERFWIAIIAANLTGLLLAQRAGLIKVDAKGLLNWAISQLEAQRNTVTENTLSPIEQIGSFLNEHIRDTIVLDSSSAGLGITSVLRKPTNELLCRLEIDLGVMYVDRTRLRKWCAKNNVAYNSLRRDLVAHMVLIDTGRRRCLGAGTDYATAQVHCWVLDMRTTHMADMKSAIQQGEVINIARGKKA